MIEVNNSPASMMPRPVLFLTRSLIYCFQSLLIVFSSSAFTSTFFPSLPDSLRSKRLFCLDFPSSFPSLSFPFFINLDHFPWTVSMRDNICFIFFSPPRPCQLLSCSPSSYFSLLFLYSFCITCLHFWFLTLPLHLPNLHPTPLSPAPSPCQLSSVLPLPPSTCLLWVTRHPAKLPFCVSLKQKVTKIINFD